MAMSIVTREFKHKTNAAWSAVVQYGWGSDPTTVSIKRGDAIDVLSLCVDSDIACLWCDETLYILGAHMQPTTTQIKGVKLISYEYRMHDYVSKIRCICTHEARNTLICVRDGHAYLDYRPGKQNLELYVSDNKWEIITQIPYGIWNSVVEVAPGVLSLSDRRKESGEEVNPDVTGLIYEIFDDNWIEGPPGEKPNLLSVSGVSFSNAYLKPTRGNMLSAAVEWRH